MIEAGGKLVLPGFVNAHYHSHDVLAKGMFEEMPFDVWTLHSNPGNYGTRSHQEIRLRTLIGAAEMLRNGITTVQDFLTVVPQDEAYVDTVLSAYAEAGIRVVFAVAARDLAALDIAPFIPKDLPEAIRKRLAGADRSAKQRARFRRRPDQAPRQESDAAADLGAGAVGAAALLARTAGRHRGAVARAGPAGVHPRLRDPHPGVGGAAADVRRRCSTCWRRPG